MVKMITLTNDKSNRGPFHIRRPTTLLCCEYCGRPMVKSLICVWTEDKYGHSHEVTLLHYHCQKEFEFNNADKGKWFSRGMPARFITW